MSPKNSEKKLQDYPASSRNEIETQAGQILKQHGLFSIPVDPVLLANRLGIKVYNARFSDESISGMVRKNGNNIAFLINENEPPYRKRFTIAHELGHHFLHLSGIEDADIITKKEDLFRGHDTDDLESIQVKRKEIQANQFAAGLLMPIPLLRELYTTQTKELSTLARMFNVSEEAMGYRLDNLRLL